MRRCIRQKRGNMTQLLSAGFTRLFKNKIFWSGTAFLSGLLIYVVIQNHIDMVRYPDVYFYTGTTFMFAPFQVIGIFISCFTGLFLGTEYKDGTMRNKLIVGRSRTEVYLSNLTVCFAASLFASIAAVSVTFITSVALIGNPTLTVGQIMEFSGLGALMLAAFAGIFTLISMLVPSRSAGAVINILLFLALMLAGLHVTSRLEEPAMTMPGYTITVGGELQPLETVANPLYLDGFLRKFYELFRDLLPTSQGTLLMNQRPERPLVMALCSLGLTVCTTVSGIFHFRRKDLK